MTKARITITAIDDNGKERNLTIFQWSELTGKNTSNIRHHLSVMLKRDLTHRQVVGLEPVENTHYTRYLPHKRKDKEIEKQMFQARQKFLSRKLI